MNKNINSLEKVFLKKKLKLKQLIDYNEKLLQDIPTDTDDKELALQKELLTQSKNMINQCIDGHNRILDIFSNKN